MRARGGRVKRVTLIVVVLSAVPCWAVTGDLNRDGVVDFDDFFIFADNFGKRGTPAPETRIIRTTVYDTVFVSLDDRLRTEVHEHSGSWTTQWGRIGVSWRWRFLSYRVTTTGISVSGTYSITWDNNTSVALGTYYHTTFSDRDDFRIAEYFFTGPTGIKIYDWLDVGIRARAETVRSEPFAIEVPSLAVANTIEFMDIRAHRWQVIE